MVHLLMIGRTPLILWGVICDAPPFFVSAARFFALVMVRFYWYGIFFTYVAYWYARL